MTKVEHALNQMGRPAANAFLEHLEGGTSADYLADWLTRAGFPIGATTVKEHRRRKYGSQR